MKLLDKIFGTYSQRELKTIDVIKDRVLGLEPKYKEMSDGQLRGQTKVLKERLTSGENLDNILPDAFAVCREAGTRVLGKTAFPVQIVGGIILHQGRIAEMKTGEGKTLTAALPAYLNALAGSGVHIVTVNDYLAKYQSEEMGKIYKFLGLSVGLVIHDIHPSQRKEEYACDIVYGTNNEFGFDYLRDNMVTHLEEKVCRGYNFVVVDEVDSILIDEARTPLIISGPGEKSTELYTQVDVFAKRLKMHKVVELDDKELNDEVDGDYLVDEKAKTVTLTPHGIKKAEQYFNVENLSDAENSTLQHHINQAIRAYGIMNKDVDYVVKDGEVLIVDEFTGRLMIGRRYSNGLHQAIEAKEGVTVERESQTLATITFQNFFRLYKKLSGMTGTALTEEGEFREIYKLDIIEVPTNMPCIRKDLEDVVYKTEKGKFNAVIDQIVECHAKGQPVLVGTVSIDKSELLSRMLKVRGIKHEVLNAKFHEKEAQIVAQAGQKGAVTIATNMAGRGTDILLGGNPEFLTVSEMIKKGYTQEMIDEASSFSETFDEEVLAAREVFNKTLSKYKEKIKPDAEAVCETGGVFIIGTERHESRRIDNQLRGRSGRQGDPGESKFFISLEDDLMRLFNGDKIQSLMNALKVDEDQPIENKMLTNSIESAQRKVEGKNFGIRKNVLSFDDVMNNQRAIIYGQRDKVLNNDDIKEFILNMIRDSIKSTVNTYLVDEEVHDDWNILGLKSHYLGLLTAENDFEYTINELADIDKKDIVKMLTDRALEMYEAREKIVPAETMREIERVILLKNVDRNWIAHIDEMDELRRGIYLRAYGQRDPITEFRIEGFEMFDRMIDEIREDTVKILLSMRIRVEQPPMEREQVAVASSESHGDQEKVVRRVPVKKENIGRNDMCPCGSGKKYKKCCGQ